MLTVQDLIITLQNFWAQRGCLIHQGHDVETGAGTFNPATFLRCLGPEPYRAAYVEMSRRPKDGRYGQNPNRMQMFHQYQVVFKPSPADIQQMYLESLEAIGFKLSEHDIRFVHDDWEQPTLGASGLGWEVWRDGMEVTQFTYFQTVGGLECRPVTVELTYGIERLAMVVQGVDSVWELMWNDQISYADMFRENEIEWSKYNFEFADVDLLLRHFRDYEEEAKRLLGEGLPSCAYDYVMKASHAFNVLDARGVISVTQRTGYITRIRDLARSAAEAFVGQREALDFPLMGAFGSKHEEVPKGPPETPSGEFDPEVREDFVLEIGSEELPATFVPIGARNLHAALQRFLTDSGLPFESAEVYGTPRRLAVYVRGLAQGLAAKSVERRGPKVSAPAKAIEGFFRSLGVAVPEKPQVRGDYIYGTAQEPARSAAEMLAEALPELILGIDFPKKMRWGDGEIRYARPLRWLVALHGERIVPFGVDDLHSGRISWAHAQLCPGQFGIKRAEGYLAELRDHKVVVDIDERKEAILAQLSQVEEQLGLQVGSLEAVLPQVLHLCEWPQVTTAAFDPEFLQVPQEVLVSEMVHHQKYFPLVDAENHLSNQFVIVADNTPNDEIRSGNMKVLSARLADGKFLYEQDLHVPLVTLQKKLVQIIFREGLGTLADKARRLEQTVIILHGHLPLGDLDALKRAAALAKVDLASELVGEFPDLQGTIGKHYALAHGENLAVAQAIDEHYMPRGEYAPLPSTPAGTLLSLAERIDNILGCFALGLIPTSSSDPYGLRRQALGIIRILLQHHAHLPLREVLAQCYEALLVATGRPHSPLLLGQVCDFFTGRIKTVFESFGLTKEETAASLTSPFSDVYDTFLRAQALHAFRETAAYPLLAEVFRRAAGQLETAGVKEVRFDAALLQEPAEKALHQALEGFHDAFTAALAQRRYSDAYGLLAQLQPTLADLFDHVRILVDDEALKRNRLGLLQRVLDLFGQLIDFRVTIGGGGGR